MNGSQNTWKSQHCNHYIITCDFGGGSRKQYHMHRPPRQPYIRHAQTPPLRKNPPIVSHAHWTASRTKIIKTSQSKYMLAISKKIVKEMLTLSTLRRTADHCPVLAAANCNLITKYYNTFCTNQNRASNIFFLLDWSKGVARPEWKHLPILSWKVWTDEIIYFPMSLCVQNFVPLWYFLRRPLCSVWYRHLIYPFSKKETDFLQF